MVFEKFTVYFRFWKKGITRALSHDSGDMSVCVCAEGHERISNVPE